jgi:hypothetical protein
MAASGKYTRTGAVGLAARSTFSTAADTAIYIEIGVAGIQTDCCMLQRACAWQMLKQHHGLAPNENARKVQSNFPLSIVNRLIPNFCI